MSLILDIATVVIVLAIVIASWKKGLVRSVIDLAGYVAALVVSYLLCTQVGNWIYGTLIRPFVEGTVKGYISSSLGSAASKAASLSAADITSFASSIPAAFRSMLGQYSLSTQTMSQIASQTANSAGNTVASEVTKTIVTPIALVISRGIAFALIFSLCMVAVRILSHVLGGIFRLPVLSTINHIGGACIGALKAAIVMFLICTVMAVLVPVFSLKQKPPITQQTIEKTTVFIIFYNHDPITQVLLKK
ncbi:MAG: CvpA family protein [Clostridia bacterium]|nr:CvpA family protein [Clostridia bacterium]MDR3643995.1 CvpA family protein [Clostridia bacterium]